MISFTATEAKNRFGELLEQSLVSPVQISKQGRPVAVLSSLRDYEHAQRNNEKARHDLLEWIQKDKPAPASEDLPNWTEEEEQYATALRKKHGFES